MRSTLDIAAAALADVPLNISSIELQIARLSLAPEDTLVVKAVDMFISAELAECVKQDVVAATGHTKVMVIDKTVELSVLEQQAAE